ncbi:MAG TPA: hypothetical protein VGX76_05065 [Pirellulales bacterium]|jgi:hypothetical protein|nr:hypothetical protein [Pirellulales bacterium]
MSGYSLFDPGSCCCAPNCALCESGTTPPNGYTVLLPTFDGTIWTTRGACVCTDCTTIAGLYELLPAKNGQFPGTGCLNQCGTTAPPDTPGFCDTGPRCLWFLHEPPAYCDFTLNLVVEGTYNCPNGPDTCTAHTAHARMWLAMTWECEDVHLGHVIVAHVWAANLPTAVGDGKVICTATNLSLAYGGVWSDLYPFPCSGTSPRCSPLLGPGPGFHLLPVIVNSV